jgi:hypothetical protein
MYKLDQVNQQVALPPQEWKETIFICALLPQSETKTTNSGTDDWDICTIKVLNY